MDGYQFLASIFQSLVSLAWPAAIFGCVYLFRERVRELLPLLRMKYKDLDVSFRLEQAEKDAKALPKAGKHPEIESTPEERTRFEQVAEVSPRAAILETRAEIEETVIKMAERLGGLEGKRTPSLLMAIRALRNRQVISPETSALLDDLRTVGNTAAHGREVQFTKDEALRFRSLADQALTRLRDEEFDHVDLYRELPDVEH